MSVSAQQLPAIADREAVEPWQITVTRNLARWVIIQAARDAMIDYRPSVSKGWTGFIHDPETALEFWRDRLYAPYAEMSGWDMRRLERFRGIVLARHEEAA